MKLRKLKWFFTTDQQEKHIQVRLGLGGARVTIDVLSNQLVMTNGIPGKIIPSRTLLCWSHFLSVSRFKNLSRFSKGHSSEFPHPESKLIRRNSWACVTVTKNSVGTRAETFGQWADLHWLSNWFWVTNQARAHTHNQYRLLKVGVWTCYETSNPEIWGKTVEHVSRWRKTVLAPELRLLVNEQIYTGSPIDSEWQTKRARTHTSSIDCESGGLDLLWDIKPWDLRKNSWACVTVTINSVGTRAETFGQWADLHWLSNWFWVTNQARTHTHKQYRLWKWGFELAMRHQTLRFEKEQLSMCHGDDKQCWHQSWDFWSMSRFTLALQLILSDKPSAHAHTHKQYRLWKWGFELAMRHQTLRFEKNSWACVTVTKNSVGTRAETFGQWADLHWLSNWFWVTNQARTHTHNQYRLWKWGFGLAMRHQTLRFVNKQLSMCHGDDKQCWHQSWDFWSMSRFTLALQLILSDKPSAHAHATSIDCWRRRFELAMRHETLRFEKTVEHVSRWRKTVLAPELRLLVNEQIYTGSPIDSEWQTKRAHHTHTTSIDCWRWGFGLAMRHQTLRFEEKQLSMCHGDEKQCWHQSWDFWSMSRFTLALQLILSDKPSAHTHTSSIDCESGGLNLLWDIKPWDLRKTVEHVSRWRKTVLAPELRLLVNEQIYTGSPIDSEWQTKRAHTHNQYRLLKVGVWTCYETSNPEIWGKTVEHVSRWRKTVLAPELRLLVNEQIYTGSPIDSEWQTKRAHTHTQPV